MCEQHFDKTTVRNDDGRFMVSIPFKDDVNKLGDSRVLAEKRFLSLERRLEANARSFQRILWRDDSTLPLETYELNTVTYGTKSAPYLATRCIKELAIQHQSSEPEVAEIIMNCFYVDDMLMGANSFEDVVRLGKGVFDILKGGGLDLRKWSSNNDEILRAMNVSAFSDDSVMINDSECFKALAKLIEKVTDSVKVEFENVYCWTDSTVVLGWLKTTPNLLKTFIANRVSEIQTLESKAMSVASRSNESEPCGYFVAWDVS
nr:unnamed protein product [Callosobruchus analis]